MIRHGSRRLDAEATPLRPTIPLAVRIGSTASMAMIWCEKTGLPYEIKRQSSAFSNNASLTVDAGTRRLPHQNPKSP